MGPSPSIKWELLPLNSFRTGNVGARKKHRISLAPLLAGTRCRSRTSLLEAGAESHFHPTMRVRGLSRSPAGLSKAAFAFGPMVESRWSQLSGGLLLQPQTQVGQTENLSSASHHSRAALSFGSCTMPMNEFPVVWLGPRLPHTNEIAAASRLTCAGSVTRQRQSMVWRRWRPHQLERMPRARMTGPPHETPTMPSIIRAF